MIEYYIANGVFILLSMVGWKQIRSALYGGNGHLQWAELLQGVSLLLMVLYTIRVIFLDQSADTIVFASLLAGAGIGSVSSLADKKIKDAK